MSLKLTVQQEELVKGLTKDQKKVFNDYTNEEKLGALKALELKARKVDLGTDVDKASGLSQEDAYPILSVGGIGFETGDTQAGRYLGFIKMFSPTPKKNWKKEDHDGQEFWISGHHRFEDLDGKIFGIYDYPCLAMLKKFKTKASWPLLKGIINPLVSMLYKGKLSKEILEKEYNFPLTEGEEAHYAVITFKKEDGVMFDQFAKGPQCYLEKPKPKTKDVNKQDQRSVAMETWNEQQGLNV